MKIKNNKTFNSRNWFKFATLIFNSGTLDDNAKSSSVLAINLSIQHNYFQICIWPNFLQTLAKPFFRTLKK